MNFSYMEVGLSRRKSEHIQLPTALLDNPVFRDVSLEAKVLYSRMYNRVFLSARNPERFSDREGRLYIYYSQSEVMELFRVSKNTAGKMMKQLENIGLIERRRAAGRHTKIYVKDVYSDREVNTYKAEEADRRMLEAYQEDHAEEERWQLIREAEQEVYIEDKPAGPEAPVYTEAAAPGKPYGVEKQTRRKNWDTGLPNFGTWNSQKVTPSNKYRNNTYQRNTNNPSFLPYGYGESTPVWDGREDSSALEALVGEQVDTGWLVANGYGREQVREVVRLICDSLCRKGPVPLLGGLLPETAVKKRLGELEPEHVAYALDVVNAARGIKNVRSYLLAVLYNAPATMETAVQVRVNTDFAGDVRPLYSRFSRIK